MKNIQNTNYLENKKVLLRVDFNVSFENGEVKDEFKINAVKETLNFLLEKKLKVALLSHFGRPDGKIDPDFSLEKIKEIVGKNLNCEIVFVSDCVGEKVSEALRNLQENQILLLENVRFYPEEEENEENFARELAENFDFFVNDAFSVCHRNQASVVAVTKFLESSAGFNLQKEVSELSKIRENFSRPAVAIIGGAKIETKLPVIEFFDKIYDFILVGGMVANEALDSEKDFDEKVILPIDFVDDRLDIGPETRKNFGKIIQKAKTIVWNGPLGKFEEEKYSHGTSEIYEAIIGNKEAIKVTGGGETLEILQKNNSFSEFTFVSTGGGAMLEFIVKGTLPGIEALD